MKKLIWVAVAVLALSGASVAIATQKKFESKVTIDVLAGPKAKGGGGGADFFGKVKSAKAACQPNRKVSLYKKTGPGSTTKVESTLTDGDGHWEIADVDINAPIYFAKVKRKEIGAGICLGDRSKQLLFN